VVSGVSGKEICVLYRANFQSRSIEQALLAENVAYHVLGVRFFDRKEVKDVMSYLRLAENVDSVEDMKRASLTRHVVLEKLRLQKFCQEIFRTSTTTTR
jgi:superfamily I DNA/RNA helicase